MASRFDLALSRADSAQLQVFGEPCTFHDPSDAISDLPVVIVFSERDIAEPPGNMSAAKGQYSRAWTTQSSLPVTNPEGYQIVSGSDTYWVRRATADGGGGVDMMLHKVRP